MPRNSFYSSRYIGTLHHSRNIYDLKYESIFSFCRIVPLYRTLTKRSVYGRYSFIDDLWLEISPAIEMITISLKRKLRHCFQPCGKFWHSISRSASSSNLHYFEILINMFLHDYHTIMCISFIGMECIRVRYSLMNSEHALFTWVYLCVDHLQ